MKEKQLTKYIKYYEGELENGLKIYVSPNKDLNDIFVTYICKFGDKFLNFIPKGENNYKQYPHGIAHFLEHKLFEQRDGSSSSEFFTKNTVYSNAYTSFDKTRYVFRCNKNFDLNMNYLLDMVDDAYLTDENVKKEIGIILSEEKMGSNKIGNQIRWAINDTIFHSRVGVHEVIGLPEEIKSYNKEMIYDCYNTFYVPNNMACIVTGNVDPNHVYNIIKENQLKKHRKKSEIKYKLEYEPDTVVKKENEVYVNIYAPEVDILYKIKPSEKIDNITKELFFYKIVSYMIYDRTFGFPQKLQEEKITETELYGSATYCDTHYVIELSSTVLKEKEFIKIIDDKIKNINISKDDFEFCKKRYLNNLIIESENCGEINDILSSLFIEYGYINENTYKEIEEITYEEFIEFYNTIDFSNRAIVYIKPKKNS